MLVAIDLDVGAFAEVVDVLEQLLRVVGIGKGAYLHVVTRGEIFVVSYSSVVLDGSRFWMVSS